jgi:putative ABC transport system ATP-binding protein
MLSLQHISKYYQVGGNKNFVINDISLMLMKANLYP